MRIAVSAPARAVGTASPRAYASQRAYVGVPEVAGADAVDLAAIGRAFVACAAIYLSIYALEAPIRYFLYLRGHDNLILMRDGLVIGPLVALFAFYSVRLKLHPAYVVFGLLTAFHGLVLVGTIGSLTAAVYGVKIVMNLLFGFFAASALLTPGKNIARYLLLIWLVTVVAVSIDKWGVAFPWVGIQTQVGGIEVDVSRDWQVVDEFARRAAGLARSSIAVAALVPPLTILLMCRTQSWSRRAALAVFGLVAVFLTTQKGSLVAFLPVAMILLLPAWRAARLLRWCFVFFLCLAVLLPVVAVGIHLSHGHGVFSIASLALRISKTWPLAWEWIVKHQMLVFGVGLGGIGGPQRFYAPNSFNPADNVFVLMYAYFGVFAFVYLGAICHLMFRPITGSLERALPALAIVAFLFGYGAVLSIIEDQCSSLFLGAAVGVLWQETRKTRSSVTIARATVLGPAAT